MTVLISFLVLTMAGQPIRHAKVAMDTVVETGWYIEYVTDSRGRFMAEAAPGSHPCTITHKDYQTYVGLCGPEQEVHLVAR